MSDVHDASYYAKCMVGANFASSLGDGFRKINAADGFKGFTVGWFPTLVGYGLQGFGKFGFYEMFKDVYRGALGAKADQYQTVGFLVSSACAEVIADCLLCPWEALKVKMQTSEPGTFPGTAREGWPKMMAEGGWAGMYKGLQPLWFRQVPYTMVKFGAFENTVKYVYANVLTSPKSSYSKSTQLGVTFLAGYWAGIFCAIVSHPADTMVSIINKGGSSEPASVQAKRIYADIGFKGLWAGLATRILMVGTLTGLQWYIYDSFKVSVGLATTGGK